MAEATYDYVLEARETRDRSFACIDRSCIRVFAEAPEYLRYGIRRSPYLADNS